ncbi:hypothetical protein [Stieleria varia]|uniref:Uncharacterized protein n=1 Tax=Stieleria varia TaxID=2528005 RepID=A0A5C6AZF2_9BACT|nr:hypothetical protein [Stieleria varia]TWU04386.1 hypothetical protein Pla52n_24260 [Stieleria varia]
MPAPSVHNDTTMINSPNSFGLGIANSSSCGESHSTGDESGTFFDRRRGNESGGKAERRQFGSSHDGLTENGRELALAIDQYKLAHHRRYITCDEMLAVLSTLGYRKCDE